MRQVAEVKYQKTENYTSLQKGVGMKKSLVCLFALCVFACNTSPTSAPSSESPATIAPSPTVFSAARSTPVPPTPTFEEQMVEQTQVPVFAPPLIIPTIPAGKSIQLSSINMIDAQIGWAIFLESTRVLRPDFQGDPFLKQPEGYILRTTDGGKTWQNVTPPTGAYSPGGFFALDAKTAWASDNVPCCTNITAARLWRTRDGGKTWQASQPFSVKITDEERSEFHLPIQIQFIDQNTGWLLSSSRAGMSYELRGILLHTSDGGDTWTAKFGLYGFMVNCWNGGIAFLNSTTGWFGTSCVSRGKTMIPFNRMFEDGGLKVLQTTDGGNSFTYSTIIPTPPDLQELAATNPEMDCGETRVTAFTPNAIGIEWECRVYSGFEHHDYKYFSFSADMGNIWNTWDPSSNEYFLDANHGWRLLSPGQLQQTSDGGLNWTTLKTVSWEDAQFEFVNPLEGWAIVSNAQETALVHTIDGGQSWTEIKPIIAP
jgi:hypothetical protein